MNSKRLRLRGSSTLVPSGHQPTQRRSRIRIRGAAAEALLAEVMQDLGPWTCERATSVLDRVGGPNT
jgi:hypothetical protein